MTYYSQYNPYRSYTKVPPLAPTHHNVLGLFSMENTSVFTAVRSVLDTDSDHISELEFDRSCHTAMAIPSRMAPFCDYEPAAPTGPSQVPDAETWAAVRREWDAFVPGPVDPPSYAMSSYTKEHVDASLNHSHNPPLKRSSPSLLPKLSFPSPTSPTHSSTGSLKGFPRLQPIAPGPLDITLAIPSVVHDVLIEQVYEWDIDVDMDESDDETRLSTTTALDLLNDIQAGKHLLGLKNFPSQPHHGQPPIYVKSNPKDTSTLKKPIAEYCFRPLPGSDEAPQTPFIPTISLPPSATSSTFFRKACSYPFGGGYHRPDLVPPV